MKIAEAYAVIGILNGIRFDELPEKDTLTLWKDYIAIRPVCEKYDKDKQAILDKFQKDWEGSIALVGALRRDNKPVVGHDDFLKAEKVANLALQSLFDTEVDISITPVKIGALRGVSATFEQLAILEKCGLIEA